MLIRLFIVKPNQKNMVGEILLKKLFLTMEKNTMKQVIKVILQKDIYEHMFMLVLLVMNVSLRGIQE